MPIAVNAYRSRTGARHGRGFTLPEASLAVLIVGIGFLAVMELFSACTIENQRATQVTTAQLLCTNIQELSAGLAFKDPYYASTNWGPEAAETPEDKLFNLQLGRSTGKTIWTYVGTHTQYNREHMKSDRTRGCF